jgi:SAM-dependent methyltransferase
LPSGVFDVAHARTLLITVPEPEVVLAEMVRLTRPGGWVVALEPDTEPMICYPPHPAVERLRELFGAAFARNGADPSIGRRVPELYRRAGLTDVGVEAVAALYPLGHSRRSIRADLVRSMRTQIMAMGLSDAVELEQIDAAARDHYRNPDVLVMPSLNFLVWGRRPAVV